MSEAPANGSPVTVATSGDVAIITIDDGKANALSFALIEAVESALADAATNAKAAVIIGREGKFSAGFDLSVMTGGVDDARRLLSAGARLGLTIFTSPIPVVLGVTGHALAMGGILTTTADLRIGAAGPYKLGLNEVAIGMPVPAFAVELCRDRLNPAWFTRCVQHAYICSPDEAIVAGFLDEVVPLEEVHERSVTVASELGARVHAGPFRTTRRAVRGALAQTLVEGLDADMALFDVS